LFACIMVASSVASPTLCHPLKLAAVRLQGLQQYNKAARLTAIQWDCKACSNAM